MQHNEKSIIIIGAGLGGLVCGAMLSKKGYKVKIFEKLNQPGGYVNTFRRGDYLFEGSTHMVGGFDDPAYLKQILDDLDIDIRFNRLKHCYETIIYNENFDISKRYLLRAGMQNIVYDLIKYFPGNNVSINDYFNTINNISKDLLDMKEKAGQGIKIDYTDYRNFISYKEKTYKDLLALTDNDLLEFILSQICYHFLLSEPGKLSALALAGLNYQLLLRNPLFFKNGSKDLLASLVNIIKDNDNEILYNCPVNKIILNEKKQAEGVQLDNGDIFKCDCIVSNLTPYSTFNNLFDRIDLQDSDFTQKLSLYKSSRSVFQVYLGLPFGLDKYGFKSPVTFFNSSPGFGKFFNVNEPGINGFAFTNFSLMSDRFSSPGKTSLVISVVDSYDRWKGLNREDYLNEKVSYQQKVIREAIKVTKLPLDAAEIKFSGTPRTFESYSGKSGGAAYGVIKGRDSWNKYDNTTPINNLFLTGADTTNLGSFSGIFKSSLDCTKKISLNI